MQVGVGYSEHTDSVAAGKQAAAAALSKAGRTDSCDLVLLFSTARHNPQELREGVVSAVGDTPRVYGGGAVGIITNETFGYAGDQAGVACIWLDGAQCDVLMDGGLLEGEEATGVRLGQKLAETGATADTPMMMFYDAVDRTHGDVRLMMATWLLAGLEKGLGFVPDLVGAGLQGDHICSPGPQFTGEGIGAHYAMALAFSDDIQMDNAIIHGCRPASEYYTVTKAEGPVILEINGKPAIPFIDELLGGAIKPAEYPFFLLFGINHGDPWGTYDENNYASRLCLGIDEARNGIVMFEPDMVEGTEFQLMFRSLDFDYMKPKIEALFDGLGEDREPVFAMYIDCAGRCAGYGGTELEDAVVLQEAVQSRVPLLGLYTGVEIAPMGGRPRGLDWTGVFCLLSQPKNGRRGTRAKPRKETAVWESGPQKKGSEIPLDAMLKLSAQNAAKVLSLDAQSIALRHELEHKRRGFALLAELSVSLRHAASYENLFIPVARRINAALNMQKTAVLVRSGGDGLFVPSVLQGYTNDEKARLAGLRLRIGPEMLDPERPVLVTAADDPARLADIRGALLLPYFIASPVVLQQEVTAILITGRMVEQTPFLSRLGHTDMETVQAITTLLASVLVHGRLEAAEERAHSMLNAMPLCCVFWDEEGNQTDCNEEALRLFGVPSKEQFLKRFYKLSPEFQPDGRPSEETARALVLSAFITGEARFEWVYMTQDGEYIPSEVTLGRVPQGENYAVAGYIRDLRAQKAAMEEISKARELAEENVRAKSEFLASVSHEVRTPVNAIMAMARALSDTALDENIKPLVEQGLRSARLLTAAIDSILDYSQIEAGQIALERKPFAPGDILTGIAGMLAGSAAEKALTLRTEIAPDLPDCVLGDATRLEQTVFNLAANAVKFTEKGEVVLSARSEAAGTPDKARLIFAVRDTGIGISAERLSQIFEPLTSLDSSYTRKQGGLGMGLTVSQQLARLMGGEVTCESVPGAGSVFSLSVLLELPQQDAAAQAETEAQASATEGLAGMRVLVAEDNPINQLIVEEVLIAANIHVKVVGNGVEALGALSQEDYDLVLMDIQMPEMDGLTAAAQIRANPRYDKMPILAMTANSAAEHREESLRSGMNDHLTKPIDVDEIYAALRRWDSRNIAHT